MKKVIAISRRVISALLITVLGISIAHAEGYRYTILMNKQAVPNNFGEAVEAAGGTLVGKLSKVGIAVAESSNEGFADAIASDSRVKSVGLEGYAALPESDAVSIEAGPTPADDLYNFGYVWGVDRVHAPEAWDAGVTGSHDTVVAILDTGVATNHPDLAPNIVHSDCFSSTGTCIAYPDLSFHGTHVAGTVAAAFGGGRVVGVAPDIGIAGYNIFEDIPGCGTCTYSSVRWAAMLDAAERGFDVINMSLGGTSFYGFGRSNDLATYVAAEQRVSQAVRSMGTILVASAGNSGLDMNGPLVHTPGDVSAIINVGATGLQPIPIYVSGLSYDIPAVYSNYGAELTVSGPGGDCGEYCNGPSAENPYPYFYYWVLSTYVDPNPACAATESCPVGYAFAAGTSMATPHVAGVAGLIRDQNPGMSPAQVEALIKRTAEKIGSRQYYGHGMVDARAAID